LRFKKEQLNFANDPPIPNFNSGLNVDLQPNSKLRRWRRCLRVVNNFVQQMDSKLHSFNGEEKQEIVKRFIEHQGMVNYVPHYARVGKETKSNRVVMDALKLAYAYITTTQHFENLTFKNVLFVVVFVSFNTNKMHVAKTIGVSWYSIQKAIDKRVHVNQACDNFWGGLPRKHRCDVINVENQESIFKWWETSTTVSPIQKDVKH